VRLPPVLRRMFGREGSDESTRARYSAADELERKTQSHYRSVIGVDSEGRTKKPDRP